MDHSRYAWSPYLCSWEGTGTSCNPVGAHLSVNKEPRGAAPQFCFRSAPSWQGPPLAVPSPWALTLQQA